MTKKEQLKKLKTKLIILGIFGSNLFIETNGYKNISLAQDIVLSSETNIEDEENKEIDFKNNKETISYINYALIAEEEAKKKKTIEEQEKAEKMKKYEEETNKQVTYYSKVYGIKKECIFDYLDYMVNESGEDYNDLSNEMLILTATRELYYRENCPYTDAKTNKEYEITLTPEEMIEKYSDLFGINKNIALSIAYCECGSSMNSHNYLANNNPAGLGPHMYFENKEIGIIYFINLLKERYGCTKDSGIEFLNKIAGTYCAQPSHWLSLTTPYYNSISNNYYYNVPEKNKKKNTKKLKK